MYQAYYSIAPQCRAALSRQLLARLISAKIRYECVQQFRRVFVELIPCVITRLFVGVTSNQIFFFFFFLTTIHHVLVNSVFLVFVCKQWLEFRFDDRVFAN